MHRSFDTLRSTNALYQHSPHQCQHPLLQPQQRLSPIRPPISSPPPPPSPSPAPQELARKRRKIPESEFKDGPDGLKYYDLTVGAGAEPKKGDRVAIHFDVKFRNGETQLACWLNLNGVGVPYLLWQVAFSWLNMLACSV